MIVFSLPKRGIEGGGNYDDDLSYEEIIAGAFQYFGTDFEWEDMILYVEDEPQ